MHEGGIPPFIQEHMAPMHTIGGGHYIEEATGEGFRLVDQDFEKSRETLNPAK